MTNTLPYPRRSETNSNEVSWTYTEKDLIPLKHDLIQVSKDFVLGRVNIRFKDQTFGVQKAVLMATSLVFKSMLTLDFQEMQSKEIDVTHWFGDFESAKGFFDYLYTGTIDLNESNIIFILQVSRMLFLEHLERHCEQYLLQKLNFNNVLSTTETAVNFEMKALRKICFKYLKNIEAFLPYSEELFLLTREQFKNFLSYDVVNNLKPLVVPLMIVYWLQKDLQNRYDAVSNLLPDPNTCVQLKKTLNYFLEKMDTTKKGLFSLPIGNRIKIGPIGIYWTILIQEPSGKTAVFSPQSSSWGIFKLPAMKRCKLIGIFEDHILAYVDKNRAVCIDMLNNLQKISFINDKRNIRSKIRDNKYIPSRFFCYINCLYCINPIQSYGFISGWGIYRYSFQNNQWKVIFDVFVKDSERFTINDIFDRTDNQQRRIASMYYSLDSHKKASYSFLYTTQQSQFSSFSLTSLYNIVENIVELPEVTFVQLKGKLFGVNAPLTDEKLNCAVDGLTVKFAMLKHLGKKRHEKHSLQKTKEIAPMKFSNSDLALTPFYDFDNYKKMCIFNAKVFTALNSNPFDFDVFYCDCHTKEVKSLPSLPTIFDENFLMLPAYLTKPICSIMKQAESYSALEVCNEKWTISRWNGAFRQVDD